MEVGTGEHYIYHPSLTKNKTHFFGMMTYEIISGGGGVGTWGGFEVGV